MAKQVKYTRGGKKGDSRAGNSQGKVVRGVYTPTAQQRAKTAKKGGLKFTAERKLDIIGGLLVLVGIFSGLALMSRSSDFAAWWAGVLKWLVGWGVIIIPLGLIAAGMFLILRRIEKLPHLPFEQISGIVLLYLDLLALMHFLGGGLDNPYLLAEKGRGGGIIGGSIMNFLVETLGGFGAFLVILAALLVGLILAFDVSLAQILEFARENIRGIRLPVSGSNTEIHTYRPLQNAEDEFQPIPPKSAIDTTITPSTYDKLEKEKTEPEAHWVLPKMESILEYGIPRVENEKLDMERARIIEETLASLGAPGRVVEILSGPSVTLFGVEPDFVETRSGSMRVRVAKIVSLSHDLAMALAATRIRIQAPVPGQNYVGIEVPNESISIVRLRDVMDSPAYKRKKSPLRIPLGKDVSGTPLASDLASMPHLLIAGATGSGKSVCVNSILTSLLINNTPEDLRLILVDPKRVELIGYNGIPHLLAPVIVDIDRVVGALQWMMREMDSRYHKFAAAGARNLDDYNARMQLRGERKLPTLVIVIDEMADLMMLAQNETEAAISRLAQMARATGLHLIIATQRPSTDIITGNIKANFPSRIAFAVASNTDSRVVLDQPGAEHLLGRGDLLFQAPDAAAPVRMQGTYVSDNEIQKVVDYWKNAAGKGSEAGLNVGFSGQADALPMGSNYQQTDLFGEVALGKNRLDPVTDEAIDLIRREGRASISMLQSRMRIGYTRAARLIDYMEDKKIIGSQLPNSKTREVLDYGSAAPPVDAGAS